MIPEQHWTPTRLAINLLLQQPSLADRAGNLEELAEADIPGIDLLLQILDRIHEEPGISPQNLLARFAGHAHEEHLYKIAAMTPAMQDEDSDIEPMFIDAVKRLRDKYTASRFDKLQHKLLNGQTLDDRERMEYSQLLKRS